MIYVLIEIRKVTRWLTGKWENKNILRARH